MSTTNLKDLSVVLLDDGRKGTVVHLYRDGSGAACVEVDDDTHALVDVVPSEVKEVLWEPKT